MTPEFKPQCPAPVRSDRITLAHGGGGRLTHELIEDVFIPLFGNPELSARHDGAVLACGAERMALTTDSFVVHPLFFPGGDIGELAVYGTVNDLAMCGARPLALTAGFILEEGLPVADLRRIAESMARAAKTAGVRIVTGDTKVVEKGKADGVYINTAGVGRVESPNRISPADVRPGDAIVLSGDVGRHGMAVMAVREGLSFESAIESDTAPLNGIVMDLLKEGIELHCLRDLTRGGLAGALAEIAEASGRGLRLIEDSVPVRQDVAGACEILGLDPLYVANEGRFAAFVPERDVDRTIAVMRRHAASAGAVRIGQVRGDGNPIATVVTRLGVERLLEMLSGEQLPRIC